MFTRFDRMYERDRQTGRQTDRHRIKSPVSAENAEIYFRRYNSAAYHVSIYFKYCSNSEGRYACCSSYCRFL